MPRLTSFDTRTVGAVRLIRADTRSAIAASISSSPTMRLVTHSVRQSIKTGPSTFKAETRSMGASMDCHLGSRSSLCFSIRARISSSSACPVAIIVQGGGTARNIRSEYALLPERAPPRTRVKRSKTGFHSFQKITNATYAVRKADATSIS